MVVFRTRSADPHVKTNHTMVVALRQAHNHVLMAGESLCHRPVSAGTRQLFLTMFAAGMSPRQALALHQSNLVAEHGDLYHQVKTTHLLQLVTVILQSHCMTLERQYSQTRYLLL